MNKKLRIVFMGTPDFAVPSLKILHENFEVVGVITVADKPMGRGKKIKASPVKKYAIAQNIPVLQPTNLKDKAFVEEVRALNANLQVVVAFRMLPKVVWNMPELGTINLHGSLLPQYRGAAPINWAIMNGEKKTGVTTFFLQHKIDTGNILFKEEIGISETETAGSLHDRMMEIGAKLLLKTVKAVEADDYSETPQAHVDESNLKKAPKIFKENCKIDWQLDLDTIYNKIRGLSPYPTAWTEITAEDGKEYSLKIFSADKVVEYHDLEAGTIDTDHKNNLRFYISGGYIELDDIQLSGKKRMNTQEFLRGFKIKKMFKN